MPRAETRIPAKIPPQSGSHRSDLAIAQWAQAQHGVVTLEQLERLGLSQRATRDRVAAGRLYRVHRGVFAVERPTREMRWMAAVLAMGDQAVLSHQSAAALWGLLGERSAMVDVTVLASKARTLPGIRVHSSATLVASDLTTRDSVPCTALPRTLLDVAASVDRRTLDRALGRAEELRLFDLTAIQELLARSRGQRGAHQLSTAIAAYAQPTATRSAAEERLLAVIRRAELPAPEVNAWLPLSEGGGYRPDFLWRSARLIVEVDGRTHHARRAAFEHDRRRDRRLALAGYETRRYAADEVFQAPDRVAAEIRAFLRTPQK